MRAVAESSVNAPLASSACFIECERRLIVRRGVLPLPVRRRWGFGEGDGLLASIIAASFIVCSCKLERLLDVIVAFKLGTRTVLPPDSGDVTRFEMMEP